MLAQDNHANEKKLQNRNFDKNLPENKNTQPSFNERFARAQRGINSKINAKINSNISSNISSCQSLSGIEKNFNIAYSHQLAEALKKAFPRVKLVFLLGADSFAQFKRWKKWRKIAKCLNLAVFSREGASLQARLNSSARMLPRVKHGGHAGKRIAEAKSPRWVFVPMRDVAIASRDIRGGARGAEVQR